MSRRLADRFGSGLHAYRQLGPLRGTKAIARYAARMGQAHAQRLIVQRRPIIVSAAEVAVALGGRDACTALLAAGDALPSVGRWADDLDELDGSARDRLLRVAEDVLAHKFDLLGSGPTELGPVIDWHRDFKSGRRWPLDHISRIVVSYPDGSDIKVPWELSRFQHLPLLAAAHRITGERRFLDEIGDELLAWIEANPVELGVNWQCTMDVAIRATNWVATLAVCAGEPAAERWLQQATASLLLHARFIRSHLEYGPARGNHYLSDVVGLLVAASVFRTSAEGRRWIVWAVDQLGIELAHQVRADGCDHEASTSYHRLVAELFIVGADAADALAPGALAPDVRPGIERMLAFTTDYLRPDGLAPQFGDADDGRLLPLGDYGSADQRSHAHLFLQAGLEYAPGRASAAYPKGGYYFLRSGELYAAVRCGDVGIHGRGCHSHNDLLAFELCWGQVPLVVDPGSYLYTADPDARNLFRSTAAHATLQVDALEQNEIRADRLFAMVDRARPHLLGWEPGPTMTTLRARHHGFETAGDPCVHTRTVTLNGERGTVAVVDELMSNASHRLTWRLPLAQCSVSIVDGGAEVCFEHVKLHVRAESLECDIERGWLSPSYGVRVAAPVLRLSGYSEPGVHMVVIELAVEPVTN